MASALRSAASAAGRAARHGFSSRSPPTRHHQHSGDVPNRLNVVRKYGVGFPHPGPDGKVDVLSQKVNDVAKRDLVNETAECYIQDNQFQLNENNQWSAWKVFGVSLLGFLVGKSMGVLYDDLTNERGELLKQEKMK